VPEAGRISVALSGIPSGTVKPGSAPTEVDLTLCNDSQVSYPKVGFVLVLQRCSCAPGMGITRGTVESFDPATGGWTKSEVASEGTGTDYLSGWTNVQELPKGKAVTLRYRISLDASMTDGRGGVSAFAVLPEDEPIQLGKADLPFTVSTGPESNGPTPPPASRQSVLPFTGLTYPDDVAVDTVGNVYVGDYANKSVVKLAAGSNTRTVLPFTGLNSPRGVAVDAAGNVYVADHDNKRVVKLAAGSNAQTVLPFTGLKWPDGVAVDAAGNVYVADNNRVLKLAAGSNTQTVLPFTGLKWPDRVAVDTAGNVYVDDDNNRVVKLAAGSNTQTELPVTGLNSPRGVAVDTAGNVYVTDDNRHVVKLAAGSNTQTVLPFTGLNSPADVAVDGAGNVYVLDHSGFGQVVKLAAD